MTQLEDDLIWLAGIIDGEGCITSQKTPTQFSVYLRINTTSLPMAEKIKHIYDRLGIKYSQTHRVQKMGGKPRANRRPYIDTTVCNRAGVQKLLDLTFKHLTEKKSQACHMLNFFDGLIDKGSLHETLKVEKKMSIEDIQAARLD